ncbi:hypothetical protein PF008_g14070 [Phytophthora fragariae]|uniref:RxLR effector protein n=1 Tax=Phytophthora fragariae TaxID=53985 RepID=A0A6G0RI70_9STRA|nr:hypothetical protein PF008_g14070 [Phytophthora fragariae]
MTIWQRSLVLAAWKASASGARSTSRCKPAKAAYAGAAYSGHKSAATAPLLPVPPKSDMAH